MTKADIVDMLKTEIAKEMGTPVSEIDGNAHFISLGLDSVRSVFILDSLERRLGVEMNPLFFWDYPTIESMADHITTLIQKDE